VTDEAALRAAVLAHPDDDTPRLVYADWCDDAGDADRAAFIRAQVEAARAEPWSHAARTADEQANALLAAHVEDWTAHLGESVAWCGFERGFVEQLGVPAGRLATVLDDASRLEPVRRVQVIRARSEIEDDPLDAVLACPHLARVEALDLREANLTSSVEFEVMAECEHLAGLRELSLAGLRVPPEWLTRFLTGQALPNLTSLDLSNVPNLSRALAAGLTAAPHRRFTKLDFSGVRFLSDELKPLLASRPLAGIEELRLGWPYAVPGPLTMLNLAWVVPGGRLRLLDLAGQQLGQEGVAEVMQCGSFNPLRWLGLARNDIGPAGAQRLLENPEPRFYHLDVSGNRLPDELVAALRARYWQAAVVA
jgi:uncharacterized protein (TIGR02996 family)